MKVNRESSIQSGFRVAMKVAALFFQAFLYLAILQALQMCRAFFVTIRTWLRLYHIADATNMVRKKPGIYLVEMCKCVYLCRDNSYYLRLPLHKIFKIRRAQMPSFPCGLVWVVLL